MRELQRLSRLAAEHTQLYLQYLEVAARLGREMQDVSLRAQAALCRSEGEAGAMPAEAQPTVAELEEGRQALSDWQVRKTLCSSRASFQLAGVYLHPVLRIKQGTIQRTRRPA